MAVLYKDGVAENVHPLNVKEGVDEEVAAKHPYLPPLAS